MGVIGGNLGYRMLRAISPNEPKSMSGGSYTSRSKIGVLLGEQVWNEIQGRTVIDFGCGAGSQAIELAQRGAQHVYGIDIQERWLAVAREQAQNENCRNVTFSHEPAGPVDVIISIDAFEHFADPAAILKTMAGMLRPNGCVLVSFGPPWYHPLGGHLFSVFPWAHLVFTEQALCRWRSHIRNDGARRFREVEGGLNQMTIKGFERLVRESPFQIERLEAIPIRSTGMFHNQLTREFLTAVIRCKLSLKGTAGPPSTNP